MKKYLLIIFALQISLVAKSQTLKETQDWLTEKIESYGTVNSFDIIGGTTITDNKQIIDFKFINNEIIVNQLEKIKASSLEGSISYQKHSNYKISFNQIDSINIEKEGIYIWMKGNYITAQTRYTNKVGPNDERTQNLFSGLIDETEKVNVLVIPMNWSGQDSFVDRFFKALTRLADFLPKPKKETF